MPPKPTTNATPKITTAPTQAKKIKSTLSKKPPKETTSAKPPCLPLSLRLIALPLPFSMWWEITTQIHMG
ncbi:hypothetical protein DSO57_1006495 [Entomophthora muscae]|uniref:Uncharacterized protein n=1 Tax=Entomophthora muscae TaxID=34485 RepID=A0ACC2RME6_9FUNG|nr:hypothetical protein DSO57_1006495 [Entomophthora muscae]